MPCPATHRPRLCPSVRADQTSSSAALFDRFVRLLPAGNSFRHDEDLAIAQLDRLTGGLMAGVSMGVGAIEDQPPAFVLRQILRGNPVELDPLRARYVSLGPVVTLIVVVDVGTFRRDKIAVRPEPKGTPSP